MLRTFIEMKSLIVKIIGSIFILYHILAISITPISGESAFLTKLHKPFDAYVTLFHLFNGWSFFAPYPKMNSIITYKVKRSDETIESHTPALSYDRSSLIYFRNIRMLDGIGYRSDIYAKYFAKYLLEIHNSEEVEVIVSYQKRVSPKEYSLNKKSFIIDKPYKKYLFKSKDLIHESF